MLDLLRILGSIIFVDLVLSGDNALVIGAVAAGLRSDLRWVAFFVGGGSAILLRILLTYFLTFLYQLPYLETAGGVILLVVTAHLLLSHNEGQGDAEQADIEKKKGLISLLTKNPVFSAILTILLADATTSLDNIVAIAALARNNTVLLVIGLLFSILLLLIGSAIIAKLIGRFSWVLVVASGILVFAAAQLILQDDDLQRWVHLFFPHWSQVGLATTVYLIAGGFLLVLIIFWGRNQVRQRSDSIA